MDPTFKDPKYTPKPKRSFEEKIDESLKTLITPVHKEYVAECIRNGLNRAEAIKKTGICHVAAYSRAERPSKVLKEIVKLTAEEMGITAKEVIAGLKAEALGKAKDAVDGSPLDTTSAARVGAWKLLGMSLNMFTESHQVNSNIKVEFVTDWRGEKVKELPECDETPAIEAEYTELTSFQHFPQESG